MSEILVRRRRLLSSATATRLAVTTLLITACLPAQSLDANFPALYYSSAKAGPNRGWENAPARGAAISIWAKNVGSARGSNYVTVAGVRLNSDSDYAEWGAGTGPATPKGLQRITFWLNSKMAVGATSGIYATVDGVNSNILHFSIENTGKIYFLSLAGSEGNDGRYSTNQGRGHGPWTNFGLSANRMKPGDFLYMRAGNWTAIHDDGSQSYEYIGYSQPGTSSCVYHKNPVNGTGALRITLSSYPAEVDSFTGSTVANYSNYWTFVNLKWADTGGGRNSYTMGSQWSHCKECSDHSVGLEVIGNEFTGRIHHAIQAFGDDFRIVATVFHTVPVGGEGFGADTSYILYLGSGDNLVVADNEISGGSMYGIHAFDEDRESCTDVGRVLRNWVIEGNRIDASDAGAGSRGAIIIGAGNYASVQDVTVRNNLLFSNGTASLMGVRIFAGDEKNINIHNNTISGFPKGVYVDYTSRDIIQNISVVNNIFSKIFGQAIYNETARPSIMSVQRNLYDSVPRMYNASDTSPLIGNPQELQMAQHDSCRNRRY